MTRMPNKLGCNTLYPFGELKDVAAQFDLNAQKQACRDVRQAGFEACEFSHFSHLTLEDCDAVRQECGRLGLTPWSAHTWGMLPGDAARLDTALPRLLTELERAAHLGVAVMVAHPPSAFFQEMTREQAVPVEAALRACLAGISETCATSGIAVAVENTAMGAPAIRRFVEAVNGLDLPHVGFNVDTGHANNRGADPAAVIRVMGDRLLTTHLQDSVGGEDLHLPPGQGNIDWAAVMAALRDVGYARTLMVEITDSRKYRDVDVKADLKAAFENMRRFTRLG
ncbi:MAG: sugar phosphate isomerase/epimerase [Kiritimatiellae bacterium]|nr:sugar phosphate isomerase/epimerase [Kiritimatiellia bacterium]